LIAVVDATSVTSPPPLTNTAYVVAALASTTALATRLLTTNPWRALLTAPNTVKGNPTAMREPRMANSTWASRTCAGVKCGNRGTTAITMSPTARHAAQAIIP
jgi:hypothetical protein